MKILIVTAFFPPQNVIAAQRPLSWATSWSAAGHDVTVLTVDRLENDGDSREPGSPTAYKLIAVRPRRMFRILQSAYRKRHGPAGDSNSGERTPQHLGPSPFKTGLSNLAGWLRGRGLLSSIRWPDVFGFWIHPAMAAVKNEKFDYVISTFGPPAAISIGWKLKRSGRAGKWIIDFRDLWTENPSFSGFPIIRAIEKLAESYYLKRADAVTTVSEPLADSLRSKTKRVAVFTNGFEPEVCEKHQIATRDDAKKVIRYTGSLYWPHQDPTPLFRFLADRPDLKSKIAVEFFGSGLQKIRELASQLRVEDYVHVYDSVPRDQALALQRDANALLFLESPSTPGREGILTGKLFEYLGAKRPILAVGVGENSIVGQIIVETKAGSNVARDELKIKYFFDDLLSDQLQQPLGLPTRFDRGEIAKRMLSYIETMT